MALKNPFKLEKLEIWSYKKATRTGFPANIFTVMFNPTSVTMKHGTKFNTQKVLGANGQPVDFIYNPPQALSLELIIDGTGVTDFGITTLVGKGAGSVPDQIDEFLETCYDMDGNIHQPRFLAIMWGDVFRRTNGGRNSSFDCLLKSAEITYTVFDRDGTPLRAQIKAEFVEALEVTKRQRKARKSSPDLSHSRIVKNGDTLPLLCKEIYGSSEYYLRVAQVNNLDDFRNLTPGQELIFPPLAT